MNICTQLGSIHLKPTPDIHVGYSSLYILDLTICLFGTNGTNHDFVPTVCKQLLKAFSSIFVLACTTLPSLR